MIICTKNINRIKLTAIRNGGYKKHAKTIIEACARHLEEFGMDLTPQQFKQADNTVKAITWKDGSVTYMSSKIVTNK